MLFALPYGFPIGMNHSSASSTSFFAIGSWGTAAYPARIVSSTSQVTIRPPFSSPWMFPYSRIFGSASTASGLRETFMAMTS